MDWASMIVVGRIVRPQGNRGEVVVDPATDFGEERFRPGSVLHTLRGDDVTAVVVTSSREHRGRWVLGLEGVSSIDAAEALRGHELRIAADALRELLPGGYYVHDLVGCRVTTVGGAEVGEVEHVELGPGVPYLVIRNGGEVLVPFADAICREVDVRGRRIVIDPPQGLIELNRSRPRSEG